jgi:hypothetical protein
VWQVDADLAAQASRFIAAFNRLFGNELPPAEAGQVEAYWHASDSDKYLGRCVRLGVDDSTIPVRHYHWAIRRGQDGHPTVHEFWENEIWTTDRYERDTMRKILQGMFPTSP